MWATPDQGRIFLPQTPTMVWLSASNHSRMFWFLLRNGVEIGDCDPEFSWCFYKLSSAVSSFPIDAEGYWSTFEEFVSGKTSIGVLKPDFLSVCTWPAQLESFFLIKACWVVCLMDQLWKGWKTSSLVQLLAQPSSGEGFCAKRVSEKSREREFQGTLTQAGGLFPGYFIP